MYLIRTIRSNQILLVIIITAFIFSPCYIIDYRKHSVSLQKLIVNSSNESKYERFCQALTERIKAEKPSDITVQLNPMNNRIPYYYSTWGSSPLLPRAITQCEHAIYMYLMSLLVENIFKKYNIQYMMMAATLIGKYN